MNCPPLWAGFFALILKFFKFSSSMILGVYKFFEFLTQGRNLSKAGFIRVPPRWEERRVH